MGAWVGPAGAMGITAGMVVIIQIIAAAIRA
jgi:hypothetical protein